MVCIPTAVIGILNNYIANAVGRVSGAKRLQTPSQTLKSFPHPVIVQENHDYLKPEQLYHASWSLLDFEIYTVVLVL